MYFIGFMDPNRDLEEKDRKIKHLIKATILSGISSVSNAIALFVRNKIIALSLGPYGVGLISQLTNLSLVISNFASVGINVGLIKYIAENLSNRKEKIHQIIVTGLKIIFVCTMVFTTFGILFSKQISENLLDNKIYYALIIISFIGLPFLVLFNFYRSIFRGLLEIKKYILAGIFNSFITVIVLFPLIKLYHIKGAIWGMSIGYLISMIFIKSIIRKTNLFKIELNLFKGKIDTQIATNLIKFGFASLIAGTSTLVGLLFIRTVIVQRLDMVNAGYFQAIFAISSQSITLILDSIGTYAYPFISSIKIKDNLIKELNNIMRLSMIITVPIISGIILFKENFIIILYSKEFLPIMKILPIQLFGDFFKIIGWSMGVALLPLKRLKMFVFIDLFVNLIFVGISIMLIKNYGIKGICAGYLISFIFHPIINYIYLKRTIGYNIEFKNIVTFMVSIVVLIISILIKIDNFQKVVIYIILLMGLLATLTKEEKLKIKSIIIRK